MLVDYARVSTSDQDLASQSDAPNAAGCKHITTDKASGASINRPGLTGALGIARKADTLVIWKLDQLGRTMNGLVDQRRIWRHAESNCARSRTGARRATHYASSNNGRSVV
nr:recombinase family protein [Sphingomonas sp. TREG-RG-20F-R18-01]